MRIYFKKYLHSKGVTFVELLAVIVILGVISTIAIQAFGTITENSRKDAHVANAIKLLDSAKMYHASTIQIYGEFVNFDLASTEAELNEYISSMIDPWSKNTYATAQVENIGDQYKVYLKASNDVDSECDLSSGILDTDLLKGRKVACDPDQWTEL